MSPPSARRDHRCRYRPRKVGRGRAMSASERYKRWQATHRIERILYKQQWMAANGRGRHTPTFVSFDAMSDNYMAMVGEQKSPLDLLMEKEENGA